jgi:hypothetical protein
MPTFFTPAIIPTTSQACIPYADPAFITIPLRRIYLESPTRRTMHFSPALANFPDINPTMIYPNF